MPLHEWNSWDDPTLNASRTAARCSRRAARRPLRRSPADRPFTVTRSGDLRFAVGDGLPARIGRADDERGAGHRESRASCGWSTSAPAQSAGRRRAARCRVEGRAGLPTSSRHPDFAGDQRVYLTFPSRGRTAAAALALGYGEADRRAWAAPRLDGLHGDVARAGRRQGGQFGAAHRLRARRQVDVPEPAASASASPRRRTPASRLGKILHLTLDGSRRRQSVAGHRRPMVTSPIRRGYEAAKTRGQTIHWPGPNLTPAETWSTATAIRSASPSRPTAGCGRPKWARAAATRSTSSCPGRNYGWPQGVQRQQLRRRRHPRPSTRRRLRAAERSGGTRRSARPG